MADNWTDLEKLLDHVFKNELKIDPSDTPVVLTELPSYSPKYFRSSLAFKSLSIVGHLNILEQTVGMTEIGSESSEKPAFVVSEPISMMAVIPSDIKPFKL